MENKKLSNRDISIPVYLLADERVSSTAKLLYGIIGYYQRMSGGACYETNDCLRSWLHRCSERNILRLVGELRYAGYIETLYIDGNSREIRIVK